MTCPSLPRYLYNVAQAQRLAEHAVEALRDVVARYHPSKAGAGITYGIVGLVLIGVGGAAVVGGQS